MTSVHTFSATTIDGTEQSLSSYRGKALLIVNVASKCGLTPHYQGLQSLYTKYEAQGLVVLGFPCNQFGAQEPGSEAEIKQFCESKYDVSFPLFAKIDVNGPERHPLYAFLTSQPTAPEASGDIAWNFTKFVVDREGQVIGRFAPPTDPQDPALVQCIEQALG